MKQHCLRISAFALIAGLVLPLAAQTPNDNGMYTDSAGRYYQRADLPVYMFVSTSPFDEEPARLNPLESKGTKAKPAPMYLNGPGKHVLNHVDPKTQAKAEFVIYADGTAPASKSLFKVAQAAKNADGNQCYGKGLVIEISAKDDMSGIRSLVYGMSTGVTGAYQGPITVEKEGEYTLTHYATDNVGNLEPKQSFTFWVDHTAPESFHTITGISRDYIVAPSTKMYLSLKDNIAGVAKTFFRFDSAAFQPYNGQTLPFSLLPDGEHTLTYYSVDKVGNQEAEKTFRFYYDRTAPMTIADVLGDRFLTPDGRVYFSGRTKMKLTAIDNKSGVKETRYSVDASPWQVYSDPFYLPSKSGMHEVRFFALDNMSDDKNQQSSIPAEYKHNASKAYVDLTGPLLDFTYIGKKFEARDSVFIGPTTRISLSATDSEAGVQYITYSVDGKQEETKFTQPFEPGKAGPHKIEIFGYDNVNNRNVREFMCVVDAGVPQIYANFSSAPVGKVEEFPVYPAFVSLFLAATDVRTGIEAIYYSLDGLPERPYSTPLTALERNKLHSLRIRASDKVGNEAIAEVKFWVK